MRIGILGTGGVAQHLGGGFLANGHEVVIGTRDPGATLARTQPTATGAPPIGQWLKANPKAKLVTMAEAARSADVLVLAVNGEQVEQAVRAAGPDNLAGKVVLDTTNPLGFTANGVHKPASVPDSCMQMAQRAAPEARFVKALNCTPGHLMVRPKQGAGDQLICGNDPAAKEQAGRLLQELGWRVADVGDAAMAPYIEATGLTVINYALRANDWNWIVRLEGRAEPKPVAPSVQAR